jgi:hypothetical protein
MHTKPVARGVGTHLEQSVNAQRAHVECDIDSLAYWNDPVGTHGLEFTSPFMSNGDQRRHDVEDEKYVWFCTR